MSELVRPRLHRRPAVDETHDETTTSTRDMYLDKDGNPLLNLSQNGHLASGVPGTVAGLFTSHQYGKLGFVALIHPAIELAEKGFVISAAEARSLNGSKSAFEKKDISNIIDNQLKSTGD